MAAARQPFLLFSGPDGIQPINVLVWQDAFSKVGVLCGRVDQEYKKVSFRADETSAGDFRPRLKSAGPKKTSFRVDETQYFPGTAIRSSLPRVRREASHKPVWRFSLVFWGFDVVE